MKTQINNRQSQWDNEYANLKGIHLEFMEDVPPPVQLFYNVIENKQNNNWYKRVLDIGCGKGRAGIHLAQSGYKVIGFDFAQLALNEFERLANERSLCKSITLFQQNINKPWKVANQSVEVVFAITVIDNLVHRGQQEHFRDELLRTIKPGGIVVVEFYRKDDGYYGHLLNQASNKDRGILIDPHNNISFRMYTEDEVYVLFGEEFDVLLEEVMSFESIKYGQTYERKSQIVIFEKGV